MTTIKIKLTPKQFEELDYIASLVEYNSDGTEYNVNSFINFESIAGKTYLVLLNDNDITSMINVCDWYIDIAKDNISEGYKSYIGVLSLYNNVKKKIITEREDVIVYV